MSQSTEITATADSRPVPLHEAAAEGFLAAAAEAGIGNTWPSDPATTLIDPTGFRHMLRALDAVEAIAATTVRRVAEVAAWQLFHDNPTHGKQVLLGQLWVSYPGTLERIRSAVADWAELLGGQVVEVNCESYLSVEAHATVGGFRVVMWDHARPDGSCPGCDGPAVGEQVLKHREGSPCLVDCAPVAVTE